MEFTFANLRFSVENEKISLAACGNLSASGGELRLAEVQISGEHKNTHMGVKMVRSSEGERLSYVSHTKRDNTLEIIQQSELVEVKTVFTAYDDTNAVRAYTEVKNISDREIALEEVSALVVPAYPKAADGGVGHLWFTRFVQSHHYECQPVRASFQMLGMHGSTGECQKRIAFANIGSWSTKEELPQGIIEDADKGLFTMFQIEQNSSWYYEISDKLGQNYLYLGGASLPFGNWSKALKAGESYRTPAVALSFGRSAEDVIGEMTKYRRHVCKNAAADRTLPTIFNEYMHLSWDSPTAENTAKIAPVVAAMGVEYYVIDCGWHNEEPGNIIYPYVGQWKESKARVPEGVRKSTDFIRSLGMKAGLWIEPEIVGIQCKEMLDFYDDDCFMQRNGRRIAVSGRHFLDYRHAKVRDYMSESIRRMVEDYGADYIKFDYNQDCGVGTDYLSFCAGEGLEACADAFLSWVREMTARFPQVVFEGCASGGMRMDHKTLSAFSLVSTSDQIDYLKYPYIAANVLSAALPEQAAVWSYPVSWGKIEVPFEKDAEWVAKNITPEQIALNMINSFLGRMHLASHLELLNEQQRALVAEGVRYYNTLSAAKKRAVPYFPCGFAALGDDHLAAGLKTDEKIYLAVWCMKGEKEVRIPIKEATRGVKIAYPTVCTAAAALQDGVLTVTFADVPQAAFLEILL